MACYDFKQLVMSFNFSVSATGIIQHPMIQEDHHIYIKLRGFSLQVNYTDRATTACWQS
jgi:hypothetical protein